MFKAMGMPKTGRALSAERRMKICELSQLVADVRMEGPIYNCPECKKQKCCDNLHENRNKAFATA
jgi:hypothetical protein